MERTAPLLLHILTQAALMDIVESRGSHLLLLGMHAHNHWEKKLNIDTFAIHQELAASVLLLAKDGGLHKATSSLHALAYALYMHDR